MKRVAIPLILLVSGFVLGLLCSVSLRHPAAATPAVIFPILINLAQKHLKKLRGSNTGLCIFYEKQLTDLCSRIGDTYPARMNLPQQGSFQLGYYCQTQARYQKKEEKEYV